MSVFAGPALRLDRAGRVASANLAATALLLQHPALELTGGMLRPRRKAEKEALSAALLALSLGRRCVVTLRNRQGAPVVLIKLQALEAELVVAWIIDVLTPIAPDPAEIAEAFGLTRMEAQVAALLCIGLNVAEMAKRLGLQPETMRSHLKSAMHKTDSRSQTRLALLVVRAMG